MTSLPYLRLGIEPIPYGSRRASLANLMPRTEWDKLRQSVYKRAGHRCQICGREGRMYCHEKWLYNEQSGYQWLVGFEALCKDCHDTKHLFFANSSDRRAKIFRHFLTVNRLTRKQGLEYLRAVYWQQKKISQMGWNVNYGDYNLRVPPTSGVEQRRKYAQANHPSYTPPDNSFNWG